jgi:hypothetical protein
MKAVTSALAGGAITPGEAERIAAVVDTFVRAIDASDFDRRLQELEDASKARAAARIAESGSPPDLQPIGECFAADLLQVQQRETIGSILDCKSRSCHWQDGMLLRSFAK